MEAEQSNTAGLRDATRFANHIRPTLIRPGKVYGEPVDASRFAEVRAVLMLGQAWGTRPPTVNWTLAGSDTPRGPFRPLQRRALYAGSHEHAGLSWVSLELGNVAPDARYIRGEIELVGAPDAGVLAAMTLEFSAAPSGECGPLEAPSRGVRRPLNGPSERPGIRL